jgi:hypothetical protein
MVANGGSDSLTAGTGIAVLEGGTAGTSVLKATSNQAAMVARDGSATMTGGAYKDYYAAGTISDSITTGATANVISVNKGDGATDLNPTSGATDVLSLGAGIDTEDLYFTKSSNNLVLTDGVNGDGVTLTNWYAGSSDQNVATLQVVEIASASYNPNGSDPLRNEALEEFNFGTLVTDFNNAGSPADWALSNGMGGAQLSSSSSAAYGGDLAYYEGLNGNLTGMDLSAAQSTLTNSAFATGTQTIDSWSSISGGGGELQLQVAQPLATSNGGAAATSGDPNPGVTATAGGGSVPVSDPGVPIVHIGGSVPTPIGTVASDGLSPGLPRTRVGPQQRLGIAQQGGISAINVVTPEALNTLTASEHARLPRIEGDIDRIPYIDRIPLAWLAADSSGVDVSGAGGVLDAPTGEDDALRSTGLLNGASTERIRRQFLDRSSAHFERA